MAGEEIPVAFASESGTAPDPAVCQSADSRMVSERKGFIVQVSFRQEVNEEMKVLWLCNIMLPVIGDHLGMECSNREGWLSGIYDQLQKESETKNKIPETERAVTDGKGLEPENTATGRKESVLSEDTDQEILLGICFPMQEIPEKVRNMCGVSPGFWMGHTRCYPFEENLHRPECYDTGLEGQLKQIVEDFQPDLIHIFGTEFPHALAMATAAQKPERILVGIQGLCAACAEAYMADLPAEVIRRRTFRDWLRKDSIRQQQEKFRIRGERERQLLRQVRHVTGRTDFDREEVRKIHPEAVYHPMNETMRQVFYTGSWSREQCIPESIFLSQGDYPLKGFHYILQAMPEILAEYPEACIYIAGNSIVEDHSLKDKIRLSSYGKYLLELMEDYGIRDRVNILGKLTAEEMKQRMLESSVFVCPSSMENSPNSMAEAMLLGVPVVCSRTGGIPSLLEDGKEGLLVETGDIRGLAEAVMAVWKHPEQAAVRAEAGRKRAALLYDGEQNYQRLLEIYREICV